MEETFTEEAGWKAALRLEAWAGEARVNLLRLSAIGLFYAHHLVNVFLFKVPLPPRYHVQVTAIAVAWMLAATALQGALARRWNPPGLRYGALAFDAMMIAAILLVSDGPRGPFPLLLFLLIATAALRLDLRLVWTATALAVLSYAVACGHDRWVLQLPDAQRVPRRHQGIVVIGLLCAGLLAGQVVRQARRLARDFADRFKPEGGA